MDLYRARSNSTPPTPTLGCLVHPQDHKQLPVFPEDTFHFRTQELSRTCARSKLFTGRSPNPDEDECAVYRSPTPMLSHLSPVPTSKPSTPEDPPAAAGKIVRRRLLFGAKPEVGPIGGSSPALRSKTICQGEVAIPRRGSTDDFECGGEGSCLQGFSNVGKPRLGRSKTVGDAGSAQRTDEDRKTSRRSSLKTKEEIDHARIEALQALLALNFSDKSMVEVLDQWTRHVLKHHGTKAFAGDHLSRAAARVEKDHFDNGMTDKLIKALQYMSEDAGLEFSDVVGQILWRNRNVAALKGKRQRKEVAEDLSWVVSCAGDPEVARDVLKAVDDVFDVFESGLKGKGIGVKAWNKVVRFVEANPVLKRRVLRSDVDRLWYAATHSCSEIPKMSIGRRAFKQLLLDWCDAMSVHPWMVFVAIGSHANDSESSENWQRLHGAKQ